MKQAIKDVVSKSSEVITASASSKVLISGAYLIIDPMNEGIVLSTDAKFYTTVEKKAEGG